MQLVQKKFNKHTNKNVYSLLNNIKLTFRNTTKLYFSYKDVNVHVINVNTDKRSSSSLHAVISFNTGV